jgi:hypothetical protein
MTTAIPVHVALVDETGEIDPADLARCAGSLNEQVQSDFAPAWKVAATIGAYPEAPPATWAVHIQKKLDQPGALGYHTDDQNQPVSYVEKTDSWTVTVSHETLEMLGDPYGSRPHGARLPPGLEDRYADFGLPSATSRVSYLLEVCDPCEATSYEVGGVELSDFLLPGWYRTSPAKSPAYSQVGGCSEPRQVADGGYVSFSNPVSHQWYQVFNRGGTMQVSELGKFDKSHYGSVREWTDEGARRFRAP